MRFMIDVKLLVENPELFKKNNEKRGFGDIDVEVATSLSAERLGLITVVDSSRSEINKISEKIAKASNDERGPLLEEASKMKPKLKEAEARLAEVEADLNAELKKYPNVLKNDVPEGVDDTTNEVVKVVGEPTMFDFEPRHHLDIGEALGIVDVERAAKVSGSRFTYLVGDAALLQFALIQYTLSLLTPEGFVPAIVPHMISTSAMDAMGYLEKGGEEEIYHLRNDEMVLIGTSEQALGPMMMNEVLDEGKLPLRYLGYSPCYRREAGSYGKDMRGILRLHQFDKLEMFSFTTPENSDEEHEFLLSMQEKLMNGLGLPYRVMKLSAGDTGSPSARTYDIETWVPAENKYRETHSTSNTTDYQTRRLKTRVKGKGGTRLAHALNGTAFAIGRIFIAILENNQTKDGNVVIPEVLRQYMGGKTEIAIQ